VAQSPTRGLRRRRPKTPTQPATTTGPAAHLALVETPPVRRTAVAGFTGEDLDESPAYKAAADWLLGYRANRNTTKGYTSALRGWFRFCAGVDVEPLEATRSHVERYKGLLYDRGSSPASVSGALSALSSFYRYCDDEELVRRNPVLGVRRPKQSKESSSTGLTREELNAFLAEAKRRGAMLYALMLLLGLNGLRVSEPCSSDVSDIGTVRDHETLGVVRKGTAGSKTIVPLADVTVAALDMWLIERAKTLGQLGMGSGPIFLNAQHGTDQLRRLERQDVWHLVRSIGRAAVPNKPTLHPHDLRHTFITLSLDAGAPLRDVQDSAGHASANTTRRYDRSRGNIDRHATYTLAAYLAASE
jgi:integrase/recombinase XerD